MSDKTLAKVGAGSGILFVLLLVLGYILGPNDPPAFNGDVTGFLAANSDEIDTSSALYTAALIAFAVFVGAVAANNRASEGRGEGRLTAAGTAGGITALALGLASVGAGSAASAAVDSAADGGAALWGLSNYLFVGVLAGSAVFVLYTSKIAMKGKSLPSLLGTVGLVVAVFIGAVAVIASTTRTGAFSAYDGEMIRISLLLFAVWSLAVSWALLDKVR